MKKIILASAMVSFAFFSCKKDDKTCSLSQSSFVGTYKVTSVKYKASTSATEVDELASWSACEKDDLIIFNSNNTITYTDAGTVCVPAGNGTGVWTLTGNAINVDGDAGTVSQFDCNSATVIIPGTTAGEVTTVGLTRQ